MIQQIIDFFPVTSITHETDNFSNYELKYIAHIDSEKLKTFNKAVYDEFNLKLTGYGYDWRLEIDENNYSIDQSVFCELEDIDQNEITVTLLVFKKGVNVFIFNENIFYQSLENIGLEGILKILKNSFPTGIKFINEANQNKVSSNFIGYNLDLKQLPIERMILSNQCYFHNFSDFKFSPDYFDFRNFNTTDRIIIIINKIYQVFLLIYIFDKSEIEKDNINLKISGYKTLEYNLDFKSIDFTSISVYEKIFNWIYSETNKIEDKIGITRNILSIYLKDDNVLIDNNAFNSILSANNTYIKENISKYIETRNKLHEQIEQISEKTSSALEVFYNNFQKSIFVFISFYLSIFILKVYTKTEPTSAINKEATIMAIGLIFLSLLFLLFSIWILDLEKKRIKEKYDNIKSRSLDLLVQEDIDKILKNDKEYFGELGFLDKRRNLYISLWASTLIAFLIILFASSDYINFKYLVKNESMKIEKRTNYIQQKAPNSKLRGEKK